MTKGRFTKKGDKRDKVSAKTRKKISDACSLHGGYKELTRWKDGKRPDRRTHFGRYIASVEQGMIDDLGGHVSLNQKQRLLLDRIIEKLVFLERIGAWSMDQQQIVNARGELLPCLGKSYIAFNNALRLDLQALYEGVDRTKKRIPTIQEIVTEHEKLG